VIPLLLDALAAFRLTRLVTADTILDQPRARIVRRAYERQDWPSPAAWSEHQQNVAAAGGWSDYAQDDLVAPKLATLVTCRWCAGVWVSFGVVAARRLVPRAWQPVAEALAFSAGAALLAGLED
jgi:hypothetical protein